MVKCRVLEAITYLSTCVFSKQYLLVWPNNRYFLIRGVIYTYRTSGSTRSQDRCSRVKILLSRLSSMKNLVAWTFFVSSVCVDRPSGDPGHVPAVRSWMVQKEGSKSSNYSTCPVFPTALSSSLGFSIRRKFSLSPKGDNGSLEHQASSVIEVTVNKWRPLSLTRIYIYALLDFF